MRRAKVVCTLGPASEDRETIRGLIEAGMSVARLNASHGSTEGRATLIERVRDVAAELGRPVATMVDIPGPEVRTAPRSEPVEFATGSRLRLVEGDTHDDGLLGVSTSLSGAEPGDRVLFDDGRIETTVEAVDGDAVVVTVDSGGRLAGRAGVNVPGVDLGLAPVTEADRLELEMAAATAADFVAASFVGDAGDVYAVTEAIESFGADLPVVAKIERADAVANIESIVAASDGVMVARGDLGVECPL